MPVEVRELIIKTEVKAQPAGKPAALSEKDIKALKQQIIDEALRVLKENSRRDSFNR